MTIEAFCLSLLFITPALAERTNVLFICVDDLRPELKSLGS
jgi:hypothetical protein